MARHPTPTPRLDAAHQRPRRRRLWLIGALIAGTIAAPAVMGAVGVLDVEPSASAPTGPAAAVATPPAEPDAPAATPAASPGEAPAAAAADVAAQFVITLNDVATADADARWAWLQETATAGTAGAVEAWIAADITRPAVAELFADLADPAVASYTATTPIGWRAASLAPGTAAEVLVWSSHVLVVAGHDPRTWWQTTRLFLTWQRGRWLVEAVEVLPGPDPHDDPADLFAPTADGFTRYRVSP